MADSEDIWREMFVEGNAVLDRGRALFSALPSDPRCMFCHGPFEGFGGRLMSLIGRGQSREDPRVCDACVRHGEKHPGGAQVPIATLFADMRGSTATAERIGDAEFSALIGRFFRTSSEVLVNHEAFLGRLAGDQAIGYFVPGYAGPEYARAAFDAANELLDATGHRDGGGPWIPLGVGLHCGEAFMGLLGEGGKATELTALGDDVNVGARLGDAAATGEIVMSQSFVDAAGIDPSGMERRTLGLKGKADPFDVVVLAG